jgi:hypothetical protein
MIKKVPEFAKTHFENVAMRKRFSLVNNDEPVLFDFSYPFYENIHTIKNAQSKEASFFVINDGTIVQGYLDTSGQPEIKTLDLTSPSKKIFLTIQQSVYHFLVDDLGELFQAMKMYPDAEIVIDISSVKFEMQKTDSYFFYRFFIDSLKERKIKHKVVDLGGYDVIFMDNFYLMRSPYYPMDRAETIYNYFLPYVSDKDVEPYRKVFLSRKKIEFGNGYDIEDKNGNMLSSKQRMDDETKLERFFVSMGFEVVYPEDFSDFDEQVSFFYSVKTLASLTSSGLSNSIFMQPGGNVIEVTSPLVVAAINSDVGTRAPLNIEIHHFYKHLAFQKNHMYFSIPNTRWSMDEFVKFVKSNKWLKKILKEI